MRTRRASNRGFSLVELMVAVAIMGVLAAFAIPAYRRALEQSRVDMAGANLRAIWAAERLYWLENQSYTQDLGQLQTLGLLDPVLPTKEPTASIQGGQYWDLYYWYNVTPGTTGITQSFTAHVNASQYTGATSNLTIDESGERGGQITPSGSTSTMTPIDFW